MSCFVTLRVKCNKYEKTIVTQLSEKAPGELWRSIFDADKNVVLVNSGHRDFLYAAKQQNRKVSYICRLYIKELVLANFLELKREELLERMIEVSLYAEESLR